MSGSPSASLVEQYWRDGYYFPIPVIPPELAAEHRARLAGVEPRYLRDKPHLLFPWINELIRAPEVLDSVESIVGPDILCWGSSFFNKAPGSSQYVSWHQDATYWGLSDTNVVTAWIALSDSSPDNGNMRVVAGTHTKQAAHGDTFHPDNLLSRGQEVQVEVDENEAVDITLEPGEMSLHHVLIVHGSAPNRSDRPRIGLAVRYIPTSIRQVAGARDHATLVRGQDRYGHFEQEPRPERDLDPATVAYHGQISEAKKAILYRKV